MDESDDEKQSPGRKKTTVRKKSAAKSEEKKASTDTKDSNDSCASLPSTSDFGQHNNEDSIECEKVSSKPNKDNLNPTDTKVINDTQNLVSIDYDSGKSNDTVFDPNEEQDDVDNCGTDKAVVVNQSTLDVPSTSQATSQRPLCLYADKCYR
jgi:hypothetical protein